jgi:REP element-mobilizing transposase RayT
MSNTGMMQRCIEHDYCAPCFYMITVVTEPRRECLGEVVEPVAGAAAGIEDREQGLLPEPNQGLLPEPNQGLLPEPDRGLLPEPNRQEGGAVVALSPLGEVVCEVWKRTSAVYPGVEACECVVMPDHFHGILWVKERLARPMGHIVKAFKRVSEQECRSRGLLLPKSGSKGLLPEPNRAAAPAGSVPAAAPAAGLWQPGFQDSILLRRGQLKAMAAYIADNPRRLAAKRANPALFTVAADTEVLPGKTCTAIGNRFLLQHPLKRQIQVSRRISPAELAALQEEHLYAAEHGAVLVSPCISLGEKAIARAALDAGRPLIVMLANGFAPHYKPPGRYFDACAAGRLLMLAPFAYQRQRQTITREQCLELNAWAQAIVGKT